MNLHNDQQETATQQEETAQNEINKEYREETMSEDDTTKLLKLKNITKILTIISFVAAAVFLFVPLSPQSIFYYVLSAICMILPLIALTLYFKYNSIVSILGEIENTNYRESHVSVILPLLIPSLTLGIRALSDFNMLTDYKMLIILSISIAAVILISFFIFSNEYKKRKSAIFIIIFCVLFYAPSLCLNVNNIRYEKTPYIKATVYDQKMELSPRSPTKYTLAVTTKDGKNINLKVTRQEYGFVHKGSTTTVLESKGLLGITFVSMD